MEPSSPHSPDSSPAVPLPRIAVGLGALATLPFLGGAALVWLVDAPYRMPAAQILSTYAAVVVAFIGAIHWGLAFRLPRPPSSLLVWGVVPSIVAWIAVLAPPRIGLVAHAIMLVVCWLVDRTVYRREGVIRWLRLRTWLTAVAVASCVLGAVPAA